MKKKRIFELFDQRERNIIYSSAFPPLFISLRFLSNKRVLLLVTITRHITQQNFRFFLPDGLRVFTPLKYMNNAVEISNFQKFFLIEPSEWQKRPKFVLLKLEIVIVMMKARSDEKRITQTRLFDDTPEVKNVCQGNIQQCSLFTTLKTNRVPK